MAPKQRHASGMGETKFGQIQVWPDQVRDNQYSPCFCEGVAGRRPTTPSHKHGLCPPFVSTGLHVEHRRAMLHMKVS